jgi:hypothetical protein
MIASSKISNLIIYVSIRQHAEGLRLSENNKSAYISHLIIIVWSLQT